MKDIAEIAKKIQEVSSMKNDTFKIYYLQQVINVFLLEEQYSKTCDMVQLAESLGFAVGKQKLDEKDRGYVTMSNTCLKKFGKNKLICINKNDSYEEKRYSIAILMSQFLLQYDKYTKELYDIYHDACISSKRYMSARKIAHSILMPAERFKVEWNKRSKSNLDFLEDIVKIFGVPKKAILYRINELKLYG